MLPLMSLGLEAVSGRAVGAGRSGAGTSICVLEKYCVPAAAAKRLAACSADADTIVYDHGLLLLAGLM